MHGADTKDAKDSKGSKGSKGMKRKRGRQIEARVTDEAQTVDAERTVGALPIVDLRQVNKAYKTPAGDFYALKGVDFQMQRGEFVAVVGKSGAGKSTLINVITGIDRPTSGQVRVGDYSIGEMSEDQVAAWRGQNVGVVFQFFQLLPRLTCAQNVMLPMDLASDVARPREWRERALHLLEQVGIAEHADKPPTAVSGGQRQRVAIARALANDPMLLVADEPTGNLDSRTADAVLDIFSRLVDQGKTILMVTHDRDLAQRGHRLVQIADGEIVKNSYLSPSQREPAHA
jgi:ABC-type lipoprotein export system ATPase subunit